jgi:DNA-binding protein Fis
MVLAEQMALAEELANEWRSRLEADLPTSTPTVRESIVCWLIGEDKSRYENLTPSLRQIAEQAMDYRYRILRQRYLGIAPERAYKHLIQRLSSLFLIRNKIRTWIALSRDRQRSVVDVLEEVIQELLQNDTYMQQQILWIAKCTSDSRLRNALMLASTEEYCLRPIRNQPLLSYRFVNYLRRSQRGGMTQVPAKDFIRLVSEEVAPDETEGAVSLLDAQAVAQYQDTQAIEEQQELRNAVKQAFETYLTEKVGPDAAQWLTLYLQGRSQEAIAQSLNMPVKQVYRLREKINYHAVRVFASKSQQELVTSWLGNRTE